MGRRKRAVRRDSRKRPKSAPSAAEGPAAPADAHSLHHAFRRRYLRHPDVVGVGRGIKLTAGKATEHRDAVHFYVRRKRRHPNRPLPRFVYARNADGSVDRSRKIPTDVIEVGEVRFACGAGSRVDNTCGNVGTASLIFRNKAPAGGMYLVTCAHVARGNDEMVCDCCPQINPGGKVAFRAEASNGTLEYDVAIAELDARCSQADLKVEGTEVVLTAFMDRSDITPGLNVDCALPVSLVANANVQGFAAAVQVGDLLVDNAFLLAARVMPGDSGGLLFSGSLAVGMVFALGSSGWTFFHPLKDAIAFGCGQGGLNIEVFLKEG